MSHPQQNSTEAPALAQPSSLSFTHHLLILLHSRPTVCPPLVAGCTNATFTVHCVNVNAITKCIFQLLCSWSMQHHSCVCIHFLWNDECLMLLFSKDSHVSSCQGTGLICNVTSGLLLQRSLNFLCFSVDLCRLRISLFSAVTVAVCLIVSTRGKRLKHMHFSLHTWAFYKQPTQFIASCPAPLLGGPLWWLKYLISTLE